MTLVVHTEDQWPCDKCEKSCLHCERAWVDKDGKYWHEACRAYDPRCTRRRSETVEFPQPMKLFDDLPASATWNDSDGLEIVVNRDFTGAEFIVDRALCRTVVVFPRGTIIRFRA